MKGLFLTLRKLGVPKNVIWHSMDVYEIARFIAKKLKDKGYAVDLELVETGAALHDVGRARSNGLDHGLVGGRILRELGYGEEVVRICERHVLGGIERKEFEEFGINGKDAVPQTIEEKVVCYADKLSDGMKVERIRKALGEKGTVYERMLKLIEEMNSLVGRIDRIQEFNVGFVAMREDKMLLLRRRNGIWEIPGGGIEWGEWLEDAVKRECAEECGADVEIDGVLGSASAIYEKDGRLKHSIYFVFEGKIKGDVVLSGEHDSFGWFSKEDVEKMTIGYNTERILDMAFKIE